MDRQELAWAAGFFDGEGSAWAQARDGRRTKQPCAQVNQADPDGVPEVLERFRRAVGVGSIHGPKREVGRIDLYSWVASSRPDVQRTLAMLAPWIGSVKTRQLFAALGEQLAAPSGGTLARSSPTEDIAWAAGLYDGEGSTCLVRHGTHAGYYVGEASITQSSAIGVPAVLSRFAGIVGCGKVYGPYAQEPPRASVYRWKACTRIDIEATLATIWSWLGTVKRRQAQAVLDTIRAQPQLPRGNPAWGRYKTHCIHGHEYATARMRPFVSRGKNTSRRDSKQCLACLREHARRKRTEQTK